MRGHKIVSVESLRDYDVMQPTVSNLGFKDPVHCTALGKIIMAYRPVEEMREMLIEQQPLKRYTVNTITDVDELVKELEKSRKNGYAVDNRENMESLICLAVPIFDNKNEVIAAMSVAAISQESIEEFIERVLNSSLHAAAGLSETMGCYNYITTLKQDVSGSLHDVI